MSCPDHAHRDCKVKRRERLLRLLQVAAVTIGAGALVVSCGQKFNEPFRDAGRGSTNDNPADFVTFPDGFSNASTKCDHGNRVYVVFKSNNTYGAIAVVPQDPTCKTVG